MFAGQYPEDGVWQTYLAFSYEHIGDVLRKQKELSEALQEFRKAFTIRKKLADAFQEDAERQARVAHLCLSIALALDNTKSNEKEEAILLLAQGREILEGLSKKNAFSASQQEDLSKLQSLATDLAEQDTATTQLVPSLARKSSVPFILKLWVIEVLLRAFFDAIRNRLCWGTSGIDNEVKFAWLKIRRITYGSVLFRPDDS